MANPGLALSGAIAFLTVVPVPAGRHRHDAAGAAAWFPLVGAAVGALAGGAILLAEPLLGMPVAAGLALVVLVWVTGALHKDGLADCADALGIRGDRTRRLEVMRDPATGVFGALALIAWALLLWSALGELGRSEAARALVTAGAVGRWACLVHAVAAPPARPDGLGASFRPSAGALAFATATASATLAIVGVPDGLGALTAAAATAALTTLWARRALGGRTGDTLGATVALAEVAVCLALLGTAG